MSNAEMIQEGIVEEEWLEQVYGAKSTLQNEEWLSKVMKDGSWIFDPAATRAKVLEKAELEVRF